MDQTRSSKVLICLVVAMTVGSAGLVWVEQHTTRLYPFARAEGGEAVRLRAERAPSTSAWQGIVIEHRFDRPGPEPLSGHLTELARYHFVVDFDGYREDCPAWRRGDAIPGANGRIRIAVQARGASSTVSVQQWETLLTLVRFLQKRCPLADRPVQLWANPPSTSPVQQRQGRQLEAMLRSAGLF